ncbi:hypothetical protein SLS62_003792 [Diatrype stigma]|uniref:Uncharacterized protein n=1 Tax=Diatrype stigma TaxID=117547 RepID=A0AAN9USB6_9PEZI
MGPINHVHIILLLVALVSVYVMAEFYYDMKYGPQVDLNGVEIHETPTASTTPQGTVAPDNKEGEEDELEEDGEGDDDYDYDQDNEEEDNDEDDDEDESDTGVKLSLSSSSQSQSSRPLIMYAYSETPNARSNLEFFLKEGLHDGADFVFVLNGPAEEALWLIRNASASANVEVVERPNTCYDLGAHGEVLRAGGRWRRYARFVLLNASIRGPFIPYWSRACWSDAYLARVTDEVKLVGMTANCNPQFHIQSMIWATDAIGMGLLLYPQKQEQKQQQRRRRRRRSDDDDGSDEIDEIEEEETETDADTDSDSHQAVEPGSGVALQGCYNERDRAIGAEVGTTAMIRGAGYEVDAMMAAFHKGDASHGYAAGCGVAVTEGGSAGDVLFNGAYFGANVHPYETVFMKANRDIDPRTLELLTGWHLNGTMGRDGSWDVCA